MKDQKTSDQWHIRPLSDILWIFGITKQGFNMRMGMPDFPKAGKVGRNKYDLKVIYDWTIAHFYGSAEEEASLAETKLAREKKKLEKETMEVDALKKTLIPVAQIKSDLRMVGTGMKNRFLAWYKTLPPLLIGRDEKEMGLIIRKETRALLDDLSRGLTAIIPKKKKKGRKIVKKQ